MRAGRSSSSSPSLLAWEIVLGALGIQQFLLPRPVRDRASAFVDQWAILQKAVVYTATEALVGLAVGCSLGAARGDGDEPLDCRPQSLLPIAIAANSIPIIAFAPIANNWFPLREPSATDHDRRPDDVLPDDDQRDARPDALGRAVGRRAAPVVRRVGMAGPAAAADPECPALHLHRAPRHDDAQRDRRGRGRVLRGPDQLGFGIYITTEAGLFRYPNAWAAIVLACMLGIVFYLVVVALERIVLPWHASQEQIGSVR